MTHRSKATSEFYLKNSPFLGWGTKESKLDPERCALLEKYLVGNKVLDVGCGSGIYVGFINSLGFESWGLDFVKEFVKEAQKKVRGRFMQGRAEKLPFEKEEFDTVLLFDILEHGDDSIILKEALRVVSKRVIFIVPRTVDEELASSGVIFRHYLDKSHLREYTEKDIVILAQKLKVKLKVLKPAHALYNETIYWSLFNGPVLLKKIIRKATLLVLPSKKYFTEYFVVLDK